MIREGAWADWVVLSESLESAGVEGLRGVTVKETWVGGRRVYAAEEEAEVEMGKILKGLLFVQSFVRALGLQWRE